MINNIKYINTVNTDIIDDLVEDSSKQYSIDDCILVRTTDVFPFDGVVETPINGNAYGFSHSSFFKEIIIEEAKRKYPNYFLNEDDGKKYSEELAEYNVVFETLRRTVHFTLNGLVGSTAYGNFDNMPFVIFEPLKEHLDSSLKALRVEDVYFDENLLLSNEAAILISEENFNQIRNNEKYIKDLQNFKIFIYKGNQQTAVASVLKDLGYDSFLVSSNGYVNGIDSNTPAANMYNFISKFAEKNNISQERHFYSKINLEDALLREEKGKEIEKQHLIYILDNSKVKPELSESIKVLIEVGNIPNNYIEELVHQIGFEQLKKLTKEFNHNYIESLNKRKNSKAI